jgi:hypothetical protein
MVSSTTSALDQLNNIVFEGSGQKFASVTVAADATGALVAAVTGYKIRVLAILINQAASSNATLQFKSATTAITGVLTNMSGALYLVLPFNPAGWFETASGEALNLLTADRAVGGCVVYEEVAAA